MSTPNSSAEVLTTQSTRPARSARSCAALARQIAAAIGQHPRRAARVAVEDVLQVLGDHLHHQPRAGEDDVLEPGRVAARAMRVVCERAEARMPRSGSITGGFHSSRCRSPRGAPLSVTAATGSPISFGQLAGLAMVADAKMKRGATP
jgi:hypothetical protein